MGHFYGRSKGSTSKKISIPPVFAMQFRQNINTRGARVVKLVVDKRSGFASFLKLDPPS